MAKPGLTPRLGIGIVANRPRSRPL